MIACPWCNEVGKIRCYGCDIKGQINPVPLADIESPDCTKCNGTGEICCPICEGSCVIEG